MQNLKNFLWKSLAKNKICSISRWSFANSLTQKYIKEKYSIKIVIYWKIQNNIYYIKLNNPSLSNFLFLHKKNLFSHINKNLKNMEFNQIVEIKFI